MRKNGIWSSPPTSTTYFSDGRAARTVSMTFEIELASAFWRSGAHGFASTAPAAAATTGSPSTGSTAPTTSRSPRPARVTRPASTLRAAAAPDVSPRRLASTTKTVFRSAASDETAGKAPVVPSPACGYDRAVHGGSTGGGLTLTSSVYGRSLATGARVEDW